MRPWTNGEPSRTQSTPDLHMTSRQHAWLREDKCMSPKVMYPRLLGNASRLHVPKSMSVDEVMACDYLDGAGGPRGLGLGHSTALGTTIQETTDRGVEEEPEYSEPSADLEALLKFLDVLRKEGSRFTEVTYIVNNWSLGGVIPLKHHGFVMKAEGYGFLTLDFSRRGILWDTFDEYPDYPEGTVFARRHRVDFDPAQLSLYCEETQPFSWPGNDCAKWSQGLLQALRLRDYVEDSGWFFNCSCMDKCGNVDSIVRN